MTSVRHSPAADSISVSVGPAGSAATVVTVAGEVDMLTSPQLRTTLLDRLTGGTERLVLDLDGVTFLGTSGLAVLVELREAARTAGVDLRLVCDSRPVLRPLTIAGLVPLFSVHDDLQAALSDGP